jgi:hypothetical protein
MIERARMTYPRVNMQCIGFCKDIYVLGGDDDGKLLTYMESYNLDSNSWYPRMEMPFAIQNGMAFSIKQNEIQCIEKVASQNIKVAKYELKLEQWTIIDIKLGYEPPLLSSIKLSVELDNCIIFLGGMVVRYGYTESDFEKVCDSNLLECMTKISSHAVVDNKLLIMDKFKVNKICLKTWKLQLVNEYYKQKIELVAPNPPPYK